MRPEVLTDEERAHVARVRSRIADEIGSAGGWIGFDRYMEMALYEPGLGYYSAGARKLGAGGDFTTAPEMSRLFGACMARQCAEIVGALGRASILEIGAGSGRLAADILARMEELGCAPERYLVLEVSADLRERQRRTLLERVPRLARRVGSGWTRRPGHRSTGSCWRTKCWDALPVTRFRWHPQRCEELGVTLRGDRFEYAPRAADPSLAAACALLEAAAGAGMRAMSRSIARDCLHGPRRSRRRIATALRYGSTTACPGAITTCESGATVR